MASSRDNPPPLARSKKLALLEVRARTLRLTIEGCRQLMRERSEARDLEMLLRLIANAEAELASIERASKQQ